jgi:nicotine blue oxidoreductase
MPHAILLAAGAGARMGAPKALLDLGGRSAAALCAQALLDGGCDDLLVVLSAASEPARATLPTRARVVQNPRPASGQTGSLKLALAALPRGADFLLHTVDHPLVRADDVRALREALAQAAPPVRVVLPAVGGRRGHPAACRAELAAEFLALGDDEPAHAVMRRDPSRVRLLPRANEWLVRDLDTPEDLAAARAALAAR